MNTWWNNLNLTPQERRFVIIVAVVFVLVLNFLFIWPQFSKLTPVREELKQKRETLAEYDTKIADMSKLQNKLSALETNSTSLMVTSDPGTHFLRSAQALSQRTKVYPDSWLAPVVNRSSTNKFFEELTMTFRFNAIPAGEKELVDFMYGLSDGNSSVRVRDFSIRPDPTKTKLQGQLVLVANYQVDKPAGRPASRSLNPTTKTP